MWHGDLVPQEWVDAVMLSPYKGKGSRSNCGDYRGISLLEVVGSLLQSPVELTDKMDLS